MIRMLLAAALIAGGTTLVMAQGGAGGAGGAGGGSGGTGAGGAPSTPPQSMGSGTMKRTDDPSMRPRAMKAKKKKKH